MAESFRKTSEYNRRAAVIEGIRAGRTPSEIVKFFGYPRSTVYNIVQRYAASEDPDLNPLDYYVWGVIERVTNKARHPNVASLQASIEAAFMKMDRAQLQTACSRFRNRIEAVIEAQGGYIE
ncbi:hypothetical protein ALC57_15753 [Trachymyrmex cornetzi]|uniref:Uncharacterized protein n=1 Tax=Trachymyrmex cornetzi TaxID=471704 RepID=A0A151IW78_9HYME|nr:hypothetical protein ALC57_15753 [Trachymyrmex cornetzi]